MGCHPTADRRRPSHARPRISRNWRETSRRPFRISWPVSLPSPDVERPACPAASLQRPPSDCPLPWISRISPERPRRTTNDDDESRTTTKDRPTKQHGWRLSYLIWLSQSLIMKHKHNAFRTPNHRTRTPTKTLKDNESRGITFLKGQEFGHLEYGVLLCLGLKMWFQYSNLGFSFCGLGVIGIYGSSQGLLILNPYSLN